MDQIKTGKFIATLRKEKELTQKELAEKLGVSDKTISKWECGKGLPDVSLILPLCELLGITVNELLSGEKLDETAYRQKAEENIITLIRKKHTKEIVIHILITIFLVIASFGSVFLAAGKVVDPIIIPTVFFINILLIVANLIAGFVYGIMKKWNKVVIGIIVAIHILILYVMIVYFCIVEVVFYAQYL